VRARGDSEDSESQRPRQRDKESGRTGVAVLVAVAGAACLSFAACQLVFPTLAASTGPDASQDGPLQQDTASTEAAFDAAAMDSGQCGVVPPLPAPMSPTGGSITTYAAVQAFAFLEPDAGPLLGYDLDGVCTCPGPPSCVSGTQHCDLLGGRDTSGNQIVVLLDNFLQGTAAGTLNAQIAAGSLGLLFEVVDYNGGSDDQEVGVAVLTSPGIILDAEAGTTRPPSFDGNDVWNVNADSVAGSTRVDGGYVYVPKALSTSAYVAGGTLVATLPAVQVAFGSSSMTLTSAVISGVIQPGHGGYDLVQGQLAGRISTHEVQAFMATFRDPFDRSTFLCGNDGTFQGFRNNICEAADLMHDPLLDNTDAGCDAVSIVVGFNAIASKVGAPVVPPPRPIGCDGSVVECVP
jgi:hypothetical protein